MALLLGGLALDYYKVPEHLREGLLRYLRDGILPGDFLTACLANDLMGAVMFADVESFAALHSIVAFLYNRALALSWGSPEAMTKWCEARKKVR